MHLGATSETKQDKQIIMSSHPPGGAGRDRGGEAEAVGGGGRREGREGGARRQATPLGGRAARRGAARPQQAGRLWGEAVGMGQFREQRINSH